MGKKGKSLDELTEAEFKKRDKKTEFSEIDQKIIKQLLIYGNRNADRWATETTIAEKVFPQNPEKGIKIIRERLRFLDKKLPQWGVELRKDTSQTHQQKVYSIDPEARHDALKDLPILNEPKQDLSLVFVADPGYAQTLHDPRSDLGGHYFLKYNGFLDKLDAAIVIGAVPFIPVSSSPLNQQYLKILGKKIEGTKFPDEAEQSDSPNDMSKAAQEFREKHIKNKIVTVPEAVESGKKSLETLLGANFKGEVHLHFSHQDAGNLAIIDKRLKSDLSMHKQQKAAYEAKAAKLSKDLEAQNDYLEALKCTTTYLIGLKKYTTRGDFTERLKEYETKNKKTLAKIQQSDKAYNALTKLLHNIGSGEDLKAAIKKTKETLAKEKVAPKKIEDQISDVLKLAENEERSMRNFRVYKYLGHLPTDAKQDNLHHFQAMEEYMTQVSKLWDGWNGSPSNIHPEGRVDLQINNYWIRVEPRINRNSNMPGGATLAKQKENIRKDPTGTKIIPDIYVSAHDTGGFRAEPQPKTRERIMEHEYEQAPENILHLKLPTMQSEEALEYCVRNNMISLPDVKRYQHGNYASGLVMTDLKADGQMVVRFVANEYLIRMGRRAAQFEELSVKLAEGKIRGEEKRNIEATLKVLEESFKCEPTVDNKLLEKIDVFLMPENHDGAPSFLGRTTNMELVDMVVKYQQKEREPHIVAFGGDNVHGDHDAKGFRTSAQDFGLLQHHIRKVGEIIQDDNALNAEEKVTLLKELAYLVKATTPTTSLSKQLLDLADCGAIELAQEAIDRNGLALLVSGNHYNESAKLTHDEAHMLMLSFDRKYRESGRIHICDGIGERDGRGEVSLRQLSDISGAETDFGTLYAAHSYPSRKGDMLLGMMGNVKKMNLKASHVFGFHVHNAANGYADGKNFFIGPGGQTANKFVEKIGEVSSWRGAMNVEFSQNPELYRGFQEVTYAPQQYLEQRYLKQETWAQKMLVQKYIPMAKHPLAGKK